MFTLLGSLLGFAGSIFPEILGLFREGQDNRHELAIMDRQIEMSKQDHIQRLEEIGAQADIAESQALYKHASKTSGVKWVEGLRASVRPVITYAFFWAVCHRQGGWSLLPHPYGRCRCCRGIDSDLGC